MATGSIALGVGIAKEKGLSGGEESAKTQRFPVAEVQDSDDTHMWATTSTLDKKNPNSTSMCVNGKFYTMAYIAQFASEADCKAFEDQISAGGRRALPAGIPTNNGAGGSPRIDGLNK